MKKKAILLASVCMLTLSSCGGSQPEPTPVTFTVIFDGNGGTLVSGTEVQKVTKASEIVAPSYERDGYTFTGWDKDFTAITTDATITAQWKIKTFTVTFNGNGGTLVSGEEIQTVTKASEIEEPTYERDGYAFVGWDKNLSTITTDAAVNAQWEKTFVVTFNGNGGTLVSGEEIQTVTKASQIVAPSYERDGYAFVGWDKDLTAITTDETVNAQWEKTFVVTFNGNGGTLVSGEEIQTVTKASQIVAPTYEKLGHTFTGWDKDLSTIITDETVNAEWEIKTFIVTWKNYDGTILSQETYDFGSLPIYKHEDPVRMCEGEYSYKFIGWDKEPSEVIEDITYTAQFEQTAHAHDLEYIPTSEIAGVSCPGVFKCPICGEEQTKTLTHEDINMPILKLNGDFTGISKSQKVQIEASYESEDNSFDVDATLKWQGAYSLTFPKKNYSIQFFKKDTSFEKKYKTELVPGWGKESKYCLKANYSDFTSSKNSTLGKIWGDVVRSREIVPEELSKLPNCGAQDGYPIMVFENNVYQGLYVLTIPKDKWLFAMEDDETKKQAILNAAGYSDTCKFLDTTDSSFSKGLELEYCSTNDTEWVSNSINNLIKFANENDGDDFKNGISNYLDVDATIDCYFYTCVISGSDNVVNNMIYVTFDGVKWIPSMYDLDYTLLFAGYYPTFDDQTKTDFNLLFKRIFDNYKEECKERWNQLREGPLSILNIDNYFSDFYNSIINAVYKSEDNKWEYRMDKKAQSFDRITDVARYNLNNIDNKLDYVAQSDVGFEVKFNTKDCILYRTKNTDRMEMYYNYAYSRDKNGLLDSSGGGCVYFKAFGDVKISIDGSYNFLETPDITGIPNLYCINGISSKLKVKVTTE